MPAKKQQPSYAALQKKWKAQDKAYWKNHFRSEIKKMEARIKEKKQKLALAVKSKNPAVNVYRQAIAQDLGELKRLRTELKKV